MIAFYQVTAFISAVVVLLAHATPQNTATSATSAAASTPTRNGLSICPVTDGLFQLNFLTCPSSMEFNSCSCNMDGLAYKFFFSCAYEYVEQRTAEAKTDQAKEDIKTQVKTVINQYVRGCEDVGMPIQPLDVTSGTPPPVSGGFSISTATTVGVGATTPLTIISPTGTSPAGTSPTGTSPTGTSPTNTQASNTGGALGPRNDALSFAAVLSLLMFVIN